MAHKRISQYERQENLRKPEEIYGHPIERARKK